MHETLINSIKTRQKLKQKRYFKLCEISQNFVNKSKHKQKLIKKSRHSHTNIILHEFMNLKEKLSKSQSKSQKVKIASPKSISKTHSNISHFSRR